MEKTLLLIKPDITKQKLIGKIISIIEENNISIDNILMLKLKKSEAELFYKDHEKKFFFNELVNFITSDKIVAIILSGENIINETRKLIGDTNFKNAEKNTIRALFATSLTENAVHASDSKVSAIKEINLILDLVKTHEYQ
ncbi:MAG: nucleoside-diphosphate kinase [Magnetococcus sp. XQGC-1]